METTEAQDTNLHVIQVDADVDAQINQQHNEGASQDLEDASSDMHDVHTSHSATACKQATTTCITEELGTGQSEDECISHVLVDAACESHDLHLNESDTECGANDVHSCEVIDMSMNSQLLEVAETVEQVITEPSEHVIAGTGMSTTEYVQHNTACGKGVVVQDGVSVVTYTLPSSIVMHKAQTS